MVTESRRIPRKVREVVGPSIFSGATRRPRRLQRGDSGVKCLLAASGARGTTEKEVVQVMQGVVHPTLKEGPC